MSSASTSRACPLCHVKVIGSVCPVCRTSFVSQSQSSAAQVVAVTRVGPTGSRFDSRSERPAWSQSIAENSRGGIEGTVIKEFPPAEWRRRDPWAIVSCLLLIIVALPLIAAVGLLVMALLLLMMVFGMRLLGLSMFGSFLALPLMMFRGNRRQPRQVRQFIVQTAEGNRRVAQIGEWNSYLYEGCRVRLRGRERQGLLVIESGEDLDNRSANLVRHDRPWSWATVAVVLAIIAFVEYASLLAGTGY